MSRVLVTGASGFVGRHAVAALARRGHEVHAVARRPGPELAGVRWHEADLLADPASPARIVAAARPERLLHLAWYAEHGRFWTSPANVEWVEATLRLLREFVRAGTGPRVVIAGTCAEYDWMRSTYPEDAACLPRTLYGAAKHGLHVVCEAYAREAGLSLAWGRLFFLYGPGEAAGRFVPSIARALLARQLAPMTDGAQIRDFLHVADVGEAFAALTSSAVDGPVNIASGAGVSLRELAGLIADRAGGAELLRPGAVPSRSDEPSSLVADVGRLRDEVGFSPSLSLAHGVAATVDWWRGHGRVE